MFFKSLKKEEEDEEEEDDDNDDDKVVEVVDVDFLGANVFTTLPSDTAN